ncbi:hypothetical protein [Pseudomonas sp. zfem002]|uniref:hypothetical protein n=1 Tax=Pseudomonas sp. zfem002 TaxID=3078197 RepID=UPI002928FEDA|nr:hypothetical protein [Pseudomonas sp. zfem002]MDU9389663.1 hypothetical protein [Pseudomonas sp. zfem002]
MTLTACVMLRQTFDTWYGHAQAYIGTMSAMADLNDARVVKGWELVTNLRSLGLLRQPDPTAEDDHNWHSNLAEHRRTCERHRGEIADMLPDMAASLAMLVSRIERLGQARSLATEALLRSDDYLVLYRRRHDQQLAQKAAAGGYREIRDECSTKLAQYDSDPNYRFLREHQFDTEHYRRGPLERVLDNWLAKQIDYRRNRQNERILLEMQESNETRQTDLAQQIADSTEQIEALLGSAREQSDVREARTSAISLSDAAWSLFNGIWESICNCEHVALCWDSHGAAVFESLKNRLEGRKFTQWQDEVAALPGSADSPAARETRDILKQMIEQERILTGLQQDLKAKRQIHLQAFDLLGGLRNVLFSSCQCDFDCECDCHTRHYASTRKGCRRCQCNCTCARYGKDEREDRFDHQPLYQENFNLPELLKDHVQQRLSIGALMKQVRAKRQAIDALPPPIAREVIS